MAKYRITNNRDFGLERIVWQRDLYSLHQSIPNKYTNVSFCGPIINFFSQHKIVLDELVKNIIGSSCRNFRFVVNGQFAAFGLADSYFDKNNTITHSLLISKRYNNKLMVDNIDISVLILHELAHFKTCNEKGIYPEPYHNEEYWDTYKGVIALAHKNFFIDKKTYQQIHHTLNCLIKHKVEYHLDYNEEFTSKQLDAYKDFLDTV